MHNEKDSHGKLCQWVCVCVPKLGDDMMRAEHVGRTRLSDSCIVDDGSSLRGGASLNDTLAEYEKHMVDLRPTSERVTKKLKDGSEVQLPLPMVSDLVGSTSSVFFYRFRRWLLRRLAIRWQ